MSRSFQVVAQIGAAVSLVSLAVIILVGHMPPGSVFWTGAGLVALCSIPGGALVWALASLVASLTKKESTDGNE